MTTSFDNSESVTESLSPGVRDALRHHQYVLAASVLVLIAGALLDVSGPEDVSWQGWTLPTICQSRALFDVECLLCGMTRGVIHTLHGEWEAAWNRHRLAIPAVLLIAWQIPYRVWLLHRLRNGGSDVRTPSWVWGVLFAAAAVNWVW